MPNDPTQDRYDPPSTASKDFERYKFSEIPVEELFWQTNQPGDNIPWRKVSQTQGRNLKAESNHNFKSNTIVWQKI